MTGEIGDIIVGVNGKPVQLTVARGGRTTTVSVTIADVGRTPL